MCTALPPTSCSNSESSQVRESGVSKHRNAALCFEKLTIMITLALFFFYNYLTLFILSIFFFSFECQPVPRGCEKNGVPRGRAQKAARPSAKG